MQGTILPNPIPERANTEDVSTSTTSIAPHEAMDYHQPFPDPGEGEEYQHVNTQLFNNIDTDNVTDRVRAHSMVGYASYTDPTINKSVHYF